MDDSSLHFAEGAETAAKCELAKVWRGYQRVVEEDRRAAVLAAVDAVCFADRRGGDVWLAAAQLDSALLELRSALRRRRRFESRFELLRATTPSLPFSSPGASTSASPGIGSGDDEVDDG